MIFLRQFRFLMLKKLFPQGFYCFRKPYSGAAEIIGIDFDYAPFFYRRKIAELPPRKIALYHHFRDTAEDDNFRRIHQNIFSRNGKIAFPGDTADVFSSGKK